MAEFRVSSTTEIERQSKISTISKKWLLLRDYKQYNNGEWTKEEAEYLKIQLTTKEMTQKYKKERKSHWKAYM